MTETVTEVPMTGGGANVAGVGGASVIECEDDDGADVGGSDSGALNGAGVAIAVSNSGPLPHRFAIRTRPKLLPSTPALSSSPPSSP